MKTAIVTGGASGIGRSIAKILSNDNYFVIIADINLEDAQGVVDEIKRNGGKAVGKYVDIQDEKSIEEMIDACHLDTVKLSLLVNNAGVNFNTSVEDCDIDEFDRCIAINLRGHYLVSKYCIPLLKKNSGSNIINIASAHAITTQPRFFPYNAAKAGILGMTRGMAIDLSKYFIRVNAICPGLIKTPIMDPSLFEEGHSFYEKVIKYHPVGRIGAPEDIANAVSFLASDKASFINGESLIIDGGRNAITYQLD